MYNLYKSLSFLFFVGIFFSVCAADYIIDFKPDIRFRESETPGFMNAYCDTSAFELAEIEGNDREDSIPVEIRFYLDMDFPATNDAEFNSNLLKWIDSSYLSKEFIIDYNDYYKDSNNNLYMGDSIIAKVTSYNDSTLSMFIAKYKPRNTYWRTEKYESINFDKRTKSRFYKDIHDSISMWSKSGYDGEDYSISDFLITVHHYVPGSTWGIYRGKHTETTIVDREKWTPIAPNEIVWCDKQETYVKPSHNSFLEFLMTLKLSEDWGCPVGDSAEDRRYDVSGCYEGFGLWNYIDADNLGAYEEGVTIYLERCPGCRGLEAPVTFTYDEIYEFLIPGTAVYEAAQKYCKEHKPTEFDKIYNEDSSEVKSLRIEFDEVYIQIGDACECYIPLPVSLHNSKKLKKTWCWVDPNYHNHRSDEKTQRGKDVKIPRKIKYEGLHVVSDRGDAEVSVRIFTNLVEDYPELIPTLTTATQSQTLDFHEYDLPGEKLSKQYIYRCIDGDVLIEYDIRCLQERAYYYQIASYMMFNCFELEDYNKHYILK